MNNTDTTFVDIDNSRVDEQRRVMATIIDNAECPFCTTNLVKYHKQPILLDGTYWLATTNQWPYEHTKHHLMVILKTHKEMLSELTAEEGAELILRLGALQTKYQMPGGGMSMRFGDMLYSAGTVKHLHAFLIQPDATAPDFEPVRVKFGKTRKK